MDKTLLKGLQVLTHVATADHNVRITDLASDLNLTKSNAFRVLKTLESAGFIRQDPNTKEFMPTLRLWELGARAVSRTDIRGRAADTLRRLAAETRETVHLAALDGSEVVYIDKIDSPEPVSAYTRLGGRAPAYCVATGKALLSQMGAGELEHVLPAQLEAHSPNTITDLAALKAELAEAGERGFAMNRGEWRESVWGLASAIRDASGAVVAAVGVSGPKFRLDDDKRLPDLAVQVKAAAREISASLNYKG